MSIVSETLKKLEKKRELDKVPVRKALPPAVNEKKTIPLLFVILLLVVFVIGVWYFLDQNTLNKQLGTDYKEAAAGNEIAQPVVQPAQEPEEEEADNKAESPVETGAVSSIVEEQEVAVEKVDSLPDLLLGGVVTGSGEPYAIVNGRTVQKGDEIEGAKIIGIDDYGITYLFNGKKYKIEI